MSAVRTALDAPSIELIPGTGFSILRVLKLVCNNWKPSNSRGKTIKKVMCNYVAAPLSSVNRRALCKALSGLDEELERLLIEALSQASARVLETLGTQLGLGSDCYVICSTGGADVDAKGVAKALGRIGMESYGGDGIDWGGLLAGVAKEAVTQAVCCVVTLVGSLIAKAAKLAERMDFVKRLSQLKNACADVMEAAGDAPVQEGYTPGWGGETVSEPVIAGSQQVLVKTRISRKPVPTLSPAPTTPTSPPTPEPLPPAPPALHKSQFRWILALTFTGTAVASILVVRRSK